MENGLTGEQQPKEHKLATHQCAADGGFAKVSLDLVDGISRY